MSIVNVHSVILIKLVCWVGERIFMYKDLVETIFSFPPSKPQT